MTGTTTPGATDGVEVELAVSNRGVLCVVEYRIQDAGCDDPDAGVGRGVLLGGRVGIKEDIVGCGCRG